MKLEIIDKIINKSLARGIVFLELLILISACNETSHLLPREYMISTEETFDTALNNGRILNVQSRIEIEDLKEYPKNYKKNILRNEEKTLVSWTKLGDLPDKDGIVSNVRQTLDFGDYQQIENLLKQLEDKNKDIYFAGLGQVMKGRDDKKHNFYQYMYFLNLETNEIYELDDIH